MYNDPPIRVQSEEFFHIGVHNLVLDFGYKINSASSVDFQRSKNFNFQLRRIDFMYETPTKTLIFYTSKAIVLYYQNRINSCTPYLVRGKRKGEKGRRNFITFLFDSIFSKGGGEQNLLDNLQER